MPDGTVEHGIFLNRAKLYEWKKWPSEAKSYLAAAGDQVNLVHAINQYVQKVHAFYTWVYERLEEIHRTDIDAVRLKRQEVRRAFGPYILMQLNQYLTALAKKEQAPEGMFSTCVDPTQLKDICGRYPDPADRANAMVDCLADYADISADLRKQIVDVFVRFHQREDEAKLEE